MLHGLHQASLDGELTEWALDGRSELLTSIMRAVTLLGSMVVVGPLTIVVIVLLLGAKQRVLALYLFVCVLGGVLLADVIKPTVGRTRPAVGLRLARVGGASFPSGHATQAASAYLALAVVVTLLVASRRVRVTVWVAAIVAILVVGCSRVYLGVHWTSDVVGGWLVGCLWVGLVTRLFRRWLPRRGWQDLSRAG